MCLSLIALYSSIITTVTAQTAEEAESTPSLRRPAIFSDVSDVNGAVVKMFTSNIPSQETVYIPLGRFKHGKLHEITINTDLHTATSSAKFKFSLGWNGEINGLSYDQFISERKFTLYQYKWSNGWGALVLKYTNGAPSSNIVNIRYAAGDESFHRFVNPTDAQLNSLEEVVATVENFTGDRDHPEYGMVRGFRIHQNTAIDGNLLISGDVTMEKAQGDISMGNFK